MTGPVPGAAQVSDPVLCNVPPVPAADAVMVTGPPMPTQVAAPVARSTVAVVASEEVHWAGILVCVVGA